MKGRPLFSAFFECHTLIRVAPSTSRSRTSIAEHLKLIVFVSKSHSFFRIINTRFKSNIHVPQTGACAFYKIKKQYQVQYLTTPLQNSDIKKFFKLKAKISRLSS